MGNCTYRPEFNPQVVPEAFQSDGTELKEKELEEKELKEKQDKIAKLERIVGKKEVEIALLKNFLARADHD